MTNTVPLAPIRCLGCLGSGNAYERNPEPCPRCDGGGEYVPECDFGPEHGPAVAAYGRGYLCAVCVQLEREWQAECRALALEVPR